ncbi:MAG: hypothetical protein LIO54_04365 [Oscillospiraceae bacterium]|nr:hypothetical protein [Oscillospiraceae bacterium]
MKKDIHILNWSKIIHDKENEAKIINKGILFEDLIEKLLKAVFPEEEWRRTKKSYDGKRDFVYPADEKLPEQKWAECKNYKDNLSINIIAPTLVMGSIENINSIYFFSYSRLNSNALEGLYHYSKHNSKTIKVYDGSILESLICKYRYIKDISEFFPENDLEKAYLDISKNSIRTIVKINDIHGIELSANHQFKLGEKFSVNIIIQNLVHDYTKGYIFVKEPIKNIISIQTKQIPFSLEFSEIKEYSVICEALMPGKETLNIELTVDEKETINTSRKITIIDDFYLFWSGEDALRKRDACINHLLRREEHPLIITSGFGMGKSSLLDIALHDEEVVKKYKIIKIDLSMSRNSQIKSLFPSLVNIHREKGIVAEQKADRALSTYNHSDGKDYFEKYVTVFSKITHISESRRSYWLAHYANRTAIIIDRDSVPLQMEPNDASKMYDLSEKYCQNVSIGRTELEIQIAVDNFNRYYFYQHTLTPAVITNTYNTLQKIRSEYTESSEVLEYHIILLEYLRYKNGENYADTNIFTNYANRVGNQRRDFKSAFYVLKLYMIQIYSLTESHAYKKALELTDEAISFAYKKDMRSHYYKLIYIKAFLLHFQGASIFSPQVQQSLLSAYEQLLKMRRDSVARCLANIINSHLPTSYAHDLRERHEKRAEHKALLPLIRILVMLLRHGIPLRTLAVAGSQHPVVRIVNLMYTDCQCVADGIHTHSLRLLLCFQVLPLNCHIIKHSHLRPLPSSLLAFSSPSPGLRRRGCSTSSASVTPGLPETLSRTADTMPSGCSTSSAGTGALNATGSCTYPSSTFSAGRYGSVRSACRIPGTSGSQCSPPVPPMLPPGTGLPSKVPSLVSKPSPLSKISMLRQNPVPQFPCCAVSPAVLVKNIKKHNKKYLIPPAKPPQKKRQFTGTSDSTESCQNPRISPCFLRKIHGFS